MGDRQGHWGRRTTEGRAFEGENSVRWTAGVEAGGVGFLQTEAARPVRGAGPLGEVEGTVP